MNMSADYSHALERYDDSILETELARRKQQRKLSTLGQIKNYGYRFTHVVPVDYPKSVSFIVMEAGIERRRVFSFPATYTGGGISAEDQRKLGDEIAQALNEKLATL
jgi:hypothetical protein